MRSTLSWVVPATLIFWWLQAGSTGIDWPFWMVPILFAASVAIHELGHGVAIVCTGATVSTVEVNRHGIGIDALFAEPRQALIGAVAGPMAPLTLAIPTLAIWGAHPLAVWVGTLAFAHALTLLLPCPDSRTARAALGELRRRGRAAT